jgi:hypothetical protein
VIITEADWSFYSSAVEYLAEYIEIAHDFVSYKGVSAIPLEDISHNMLVGIKNWAVSPDGERWLASLGYIREGSVMVSGSFLPYVCTVCSGYSFDGRMERCERCGNYTCYHCLNVVDADYRIMWCDRCSSLHL